MEARSSWAMALCRPSDSIANLAIMGGSWFRYGSDIARFRARTVRGTADAASGGGRKGPMGKALAAWLMVAGAAAAPPAMGPRGAVGSASVRGTSVLQDGELNGKRATDPRAGTRRHAAQAVDLD